MERANNTQTNVELSSKKHPPIRSCSTIPTQYRIINKNNIESKFETILSDQSAQLGWKWIIVTHYRSDPDDVKNLPTTTDKNKYDHVMYRATRKRMAEA